MQDKTTVIINGVPWHEYGLKYRDVDGKSYEIPFYAMNRDHAACILQDIRETATLGDLSVEAGST